MENVNFKFSKMYSPSIYIIIIYCHNDKLSRSFYLLLNVLQTKSRGKNQKVRKRKGEWKKMIGKDGMREIWVDRERMVWVCMCERDRA